MKLFRSSFLIFVFFFSNYYVLGQAFHIMSYNIRYDSPNDGVNKWEYRKASLVELIKYYRPEILGIQEGMYHQVEYLNKNLQNYTYIGVGRDGGKRQGEFSALFYDETKFSVQKEATFWLTEKSDTVSIGWDAALKRICTYGLFKHKRTQKKIWIFNTHFDHIGVIAREMSSRQIIRKIKELNHEELPIIFMGDLNTLPGSKPIKLLKNILDDGLAISKTPLNGPIGTFTGFNPAMLIDKRIDYVFSAKLNVLSYSHISDKRKDNNYISDHLPVFVKLKFLTTNKVKKL